MTKMDLAGKVVASSKCTLMKSWNDPDPYFCKVILTEEYLIMLNDEYAKRDDLLFQIPIVQIKEFIFVNQSEQKNSNLASLVGSVVGSALFAISGSGFFVNKAKQPDVLLLSYQDVQGEPIELILNMMDHGECGLINEYQRLIKRGYTC